MEFITGLKQQEEAELEDLLKAEEGTAIILEGAVHSVRDMGEDSHLLNFEGKEVNEVFQLQKIEIPNFL